MKHFVEHQHSNMPMRRHLINKRRGLEGHRFFCKLVLHSDQWVHSLALVIQWTNAYRQG